MWRVEHVQTDERQSHGGQLYTKLARRMQYAKARGRKPNDRERRRWAGARGLDPSVQYHDRKDQRNQRAESRYRQWWNTDRRHQTHEPKDEWRVVQNTQRSLVERRIQHTGLSPTQQVVVHLAGGVSAVERRDQQRSRPDAGHCKEPH